MDEVLDLLAPDPEEAEARLKQVHRASIAWSSRLTTPPGRGALARRWRAARPALRPGPARAARGPRVLAELAERNPVGAGTLEKWIECPYRWFVDHELKPQRLDPPAGSPHGRVDRPRGARAPLRAIRRETIAIPRPGDLDRWRARALELLAEAAAEHGLEADRPLAGVALARMRAQIERLLERESRSETAAPPRCIEASFGDGDDAEQAGPRSSATWRSAA